MTVPMRSMRNAASRSTELSLHAIAFPDADVPLPATRIERLAALRCLHSLVPMSDTAAGSNRLTLPAPK